MRLSLAVVVAACSLLVAVPAQASLQLPGACPAEATSQPFLPWADFMQYVPAPDGGLEAGADGWSLRGGAAVVDGNEPYFVGGASDSRSLSLPSGASATTPAMCGGIDRPTMRFFARKTSGFLPMLRVESVVRDASGATRTSLMGTLLPGGTWQPTPQLLIAVNLLTSLDEQRPAVAFRFTAVGGSFAIDDVYVDPYGRY